MQSTNAPNGAIRTGFPSSPVVAVPLSGEWVDGVLELADNSSYRGISFGAEGKSISGECVFQTGWSTSLFYFSRNYHLNMF